VAPVRYVDLDVGAKLALVSTLADVADPPRSGFLQGGYADLRVGSPTIKLGPRFEYARVSYAEFHEKGWKLTPLMVRVVH
jgi:hypothetical protein